MKVVNISKHPKYARRHVAHDKNGARFLVGDRCVDCEGNRGVVRAIRRDGVATVYIHDMADTLDIVSIMLVKFKAPVAMP